MNANNQMTANMMSTQPQKQRFSVAISTEGYKKMIANTIKDPKRANRFVASITSAVATTPALQECTPQTILSAALLGESLELSPSPQLGQFYMVPFKNRKAGTTESQFVLGYRGILQLAIRSGNYKRLNALAIKEGELVSYDPLNEEAEFNIITDDRVREATPTMGYYAMFEYLNGFRKIMYWSKEKMMAHADRYSAAFSAAAYEQIQAGKVPEKDMWKYSSFWYKDFDGMALKTMLRQLISKWGVMSIEFQQAYEADGGVVRDDGVIDYVDNPESPAAPSMEAEYTVAPELAKEPPAQEVKQISLADL